MKIYTLLLIFILTITCTPKKIELPPLIGIKDFNFDKVLEQSKQADKPILIYFTAHGCAGCLRMNDYVLSEYKISKILSEEYIFIPLSTDERTIASKEYWSKSKRTDKILKKVGDLNCELQIELTKSGSQPRFTILNHKKEIIRESGYTKNKQEFTDFLNGKTNSK